MRILLITAEMDRGGAETHIFCLARELVRMGDRVYVVSSGGRLAEELRKVGAEHITLSADRYSLLSVLRGRRILRRIIKDKKIDLIHAHARISAFLSYSVARELDIPFITTAHARFSSSWLYRHLSRWGRPTIAVSEDLGQYLRDNYRIDGENIRVIYNGIDTSVFYPDSRADVKKRIVFMSRLDRDCSYAAYLLCNIGKRLLERFPDLEIVICGGGEELQELRRRGAEISRQVGQDFISVVGHVENTAEMLRTARVFVGVSRAALEAMGCGVPTILCGNEGAFGLVDSMELLKRAAITNFCCRGEKKRDGKWLFSEICRALNMSEDEVQRLSETVSEYVRTFHGAVCMATKTRLLYGEVCGGGERRGRVVLCGYYGYENMGDNALLRASIVRAKAKFSNCEIVALTKSGRQDSEVFGVRCVRRMAPVALVRELWRADRLVLGGGTLLQDRTSLRSLVYYALVCHIAALGGGTIELWGNGLSETDNRISKRLILSVLERAEYIGLRDMRSVTEALRIISPRCADRLYLESDLAARQASATEGRISFLKERLGISCGKYAVAAIKGGAERGVVKILEGVLFSLSGEGIRPIILPMLPREDTAVCRQVAERVGGVVAEGLCESDAVGLMRDAEVVCGMRLHALVFASAAGVPFAGFSTDPKIECFCRENGGLFFTDIL